MPSVACPECGFQKNLTEQAYARWVQCQHCGAGFIGMAGEDDFQPRVYDWPSWSQIFRLPQLVAVSS
jgi:hypothetical protein